MATFDKKTWEAFNDPKGLHIVKKPNVDYGLGGGDVIAVVWSEDGEDATEAANACLFAAATEMLEALENLLIEIEAHAIHAPARIALAKRAIAKARGEK
jgi:hypothetical protein